MRKIRYAGACGRHRDESTLAIPRSRRLRQGQGYLFAGPVPLAKLPDAIRAAVRVTCNDEPTVEAGDGCVRLCLEGATTRRRHALDSSCILRGSGSGPPRGAGQAVGDYALMGAVCASGHFPHRDFRVCSFSCARHQATALLSRYRDGGIRRLRLAGKFHARIALPYVTNSWLYHGTRLALPVGICSRCCVAITSDMPYLRASESIVLKCSVIKSKTRR